MRRRPSPVILVLALAAAQPDRAAAVPHIELEHSAPAAGQTVSAAPAVLRLRFSGFIEPRYTSVTLTAPDGSDVALGTMAFVAGSDREFTVGVAPLPLAGTYTVRWRTAGADGHVLDGSYTFTLAATAASADPDAAATADSAANADSAATATQPDAHDRADAHTSHDAQTSHDAVSPLHVAARFMHFAALLVLIGALTFRAALLPRLDIDSTQLRRVAWLAASYAAVVIGLAAVLRLWLQSTALHGADRAWSTPLLSIMLTDTVWGRAWVLQAFLFTLLGAAVAWARPARDRVALVIALPAAAGLAAIPALTGHAAAADGAGYLIVANDALHVIAAGAWLGTLAVIMIGALPLLLRDHGAATAARVIDMFSPVALAGAGAAIITGVINARMHLDATAQLTQTSYGNALLVKLTLVGLVLAAGVVNWRVLRPRLATGNATHRLRLTAATELGFAVLVLLATAVLTGMPRP